MTGHRDRVTWTNHQVAESPSTTPSLPRRWAARGCGSPTGGMMAAGADGKRVSGMVKRWDFFSRNGMNMVGLLLLTMIVSAIYLLWDVAIKRWFG